ncbi:MAG: family 20 glycosylhydrolase [Lentimicrobiaceae bacterium]|nr:family 20 glycosylhydrolase [Lentimicrobiaceae bacterium]
MKKTHLILLIMATIGVLTFSCSNKTNEADYGIIPLPNEISLQEGKEFILNPKTKIVYYQEQEEMKQDALFLSEYIKNLLGFAPDVTTNSSGTNEIIIKSELQNENPEAYELSVNSEQIIINGSSPAGAFYGIQTLRKSLPICKGNAALKPVTIKDYPRFKHRGALLDVARHFQTVDFVKRFIDILALHNMNTFHWHLTDDQGWRIEIKQYPNLTTIGSVRSETVIGRNTDEYDGIEHKGFYTQEELRDIVKYAQDRHITIIPEIDLPGHMLSALASYPQLGCDGEGYKVSTRWGVFEDVLCAGNDEVYVFLKNVYKEVMDIFPSKYIHIGGDEVPKTKWETCEKCQAKIKELGIKGDKNHSAEYYLQSHIMTYMEEFLNENNRSIIGWDEILEGKIAPNATVMSWRGTEGGIEAAKMGHDVIMTPTTYAYFDYYQSSITEEEPLAIGGYIPIDLVYSFNPTPDVLSESEKKHILGAQANLWAEYISTPQYAEYMLLPRLAAMSEVQWTELEHKDYNDFLKRLPKYINLYEHFGYTVAKHVFNIKSDTKIDFENYALIIKLSTIDDCKIYYTTDGTEPTDKSTLYEGEITIKDTCTIRAVAIDKNGKKRYWQKEITTNKATFKPITLLTEPDSRYTYAGAEMLVNGVSSDIINYKNGDWIGFQENDLVAVINLGSPTLVSNVAFKNLVNTGDWIFDAAEIIIEKSDNNSDFTNVRTEILPNKYASHKIELVNHNISFDPITTQYLKITIKPNILPEWHKGSGKRAFIFVDEIGVD